MNNIRIIDTTLSDYAESSPKALNFKQKVELIKQLDKLNVDVIELNNISDMMTDTVLYKTISSVVKNSTLSFPCNTDKEKTVSAYKALKGAKKIRAYVKLPVSSVQMEYSLKLKPDKVLALITDMVSHAASLCDDVEFIAVDAGRSEQSFLVSALSAAVAAKAKTLTLCDTAGTCLTSDVEEMIKNIKQNVSGIENCVISFCASDALDMAVANVFAALKCGVSEIKTSLNGGKYTQIESVSNAISVKGSDIGVRISIDTTILKKTAEQLKRITSDAPAAQFTSQSVKNIDLSSESNIDEVNKTVLSLGYDLTKDDLQRVYEAFQHVAKSKTIGLKELEVIIATEAFATEQTYKLESYVINSGNIIAATANITLSKNDTLLNGLCGGDGPIDAAFMAIDKIIGTHFELDDFQINAVTEGREAMGEAIVKLRHNGILYSGRGISTDIIGASIKAYISALNKIVCEENNK